MPPEPPVTTATAMRFPSWSVAQDTRLQAMPLGQRFDAIIVGAGISGLYLLHRLREAGMSVLVVDQATGIGGI